jgi:hypothetical protein
MHKSVAERGVDMDSATEDLGGSCGSSLRGRQVSFKSHMGESRRQVTLDGN